MKQYQRRPSHSPTRRSSAPSSQISSSIPNSIVLSSMGRTSPGRPDLGEQMMARMQAAQANQRPLAEAEADRLAADINPGASTEEVKSAMGRKLGADFSDVRIHTDASARAKADSMGAEAYTSGKDVYFGSEGQNARTVAHELVHTVQQGEVAGVGVTQSAPVGTVQMKPGSLFKKFKGLFSRKKKAPNAVKAGKYDSDFDGLTNEEKFAKLQDMRKYLDTRQGQIDDSAGRDAFTDYDKDIRASYESVMQKSSGDDDFLEMIRNAPMTAASAYMNKQRAVREAFNSRPDRGDPLSDEELTQSKTNTIDKAGFSDEGHNLKSSYGMMMDMRRLITPGQSRQRFMQRTSLGGQMSGTEQADYAKKIDYAMGELRENRAVNSSYVDNSMAGKRDAYRNDIVSDFQSRYAARPGRRHRFRRNP